MNNINSIVSTLAARVYWRRVGYSASLGLLGAAVGAAAILVNLLSRTPVYLEAEHVRTTPHVLAAAAGAVDGLIIASAAAYVIHGDRFSAAMRRALPLWWWIALGFGFGIMHSLAAGGFFLPAAELAYAAYLRLLTPLETLNASLDLLLLTPWRAFTSGAAFLFTGIIAGLTFGACALLVDMASVSGRRPATRAWSASAALSAAVVAAAAFGPPALLARLG